MKIILVLKTRKQLPAASYNSLKKSCLEFMPATCLLARLLAHPPACLPENGHKF